MMKTIQTFTKGCAGGLLCLLVLAGCANNLLEDTPASPPAEAGMGRLTISLTGTGAGQRERTLLPTVPQSFSKYELDFTPPIGQEGIPTVSLTGGSASHSMTLSAGIWTITARAYLRIQGVDGISDGDYVAARGSVWVVVSSSSPVSETIDLRGGVDQGEGVFSYDIKLPPDLDAASLEIIGLDGNTVKTVDLQTAAAGSFALDSGYYVFRTSRTKGAAVRVQAEIVHIYEGWTTEAGGPEYDFTAPLNSAAELMEFLSAQPDNDAASPYPVALSGLNLETDFEKDDDPLGLLYGALGGKYVTLDLSACTGASIPGTSDTAASGRPDKDKLVSVILPDSLTTIGDYTFYNCTSLEAIDLPDSLTAIGVEAFRGCTSLEAIDLPDSLTAIGVGAFRGCISLEAIDLPDSLTTIEWYAFQDCTSLAVIDLPDSPSLTTIGEYAFEGCTSLEAIDLPDSLTTIGYSAFYGCTSLEAIDLPDSPPPSASTPSTAVQP
jgi:hypothetical protein